MKETILLLLITTALNAQIAVENTIIKEKIDNYLSQGVAKGFSGSVLVARQGEIILHKGYGMADKENKIPYKITTVSTIGSVTKQFTATAILKLEELNQLKVTDSISKFFDTLPDDKKDITIHQLLTHTSGLTDGIGNGDFDDIPTKRFFKTLFATKLLHQPGSKYFYSNAGYSVLARIIEVVSGNDYEVFLMAHLFIPARMNHTGYLIPNWEKEDIANGYARNLIHMGTLIERYQKQNKVTWNLKGNGGIHSTTGDMYKWYRALKANTILSQAMFKKLTTSYVLEYEGGSSYYAYGWAIYHSDRNTKIISHNGGNGVFFHDYLYLLEEDVVIILFTNASSREVEVAWPIEKMIFNESYKPEPIKNNLFNLTFDFIKSHNIKQSDELISVIKSDYTKILRSPNQLNGLGYRILKNEIIEVKDNVKWAIELFKLNTERFPENGNLWDSLGEAYTKNNQSKEAIKSYKRAIELADKEDCDWCESSRKALKKLQYKN
ncbi:serine hydrolase [Winogradskyella flava]|uniref:serine hydrolase n=1 Tax=Winogradskyella flava TaxID=1884876 RepID=UPI00249278EE|nr:serine hydrolase [Winogradskyella flava]